jgi:hypothetical protein
MKMDVFWYVSPCSLADVDNDSEVNTASIIKAIALTMETLSTYGKLVHF